MKNPKRYLITSALPYANGSKHIGHLAGAYLPADAYARYLRLSGQDIIFVCGSDEHGTAIPNQALAENTQPQEVIDKYHALIRDCFKQFGISFDIYHRTSESIHHATAQDFFLDLHAKGLLEEHSSEQFFDETANQFLADRYIVGTCPKCGFGKAYGDQCERCGSTLSPRELINPKSTLSGNAPILKFTKHWYLPLQNYEAWLSQWILESHAEDWKPNVYGQCKSWIEGGLQARAMTRDLDWGIKVPLPDSEGKVLYVWFDAPIGYISATRALCEEVSSGQLKYATPQRDLSHLKKNDWEKYWQDPETKLTHFIGKDNIVFHCIIFPTMLHASQRYILPDQVPANEFMNLEGDKMSTSRKWSVEMHNYINDFPKKPDVLRYTLFSNLPETKDSEFTWKDFQSKNNNELVAILGNFINRTFVLTKKYFNGKMPHLDAQITESDEKLLNAIATCPSKVGASIEAYRFREGLAHFMDLARIGNKYLTDNEPWKLSQNLPRMGSVLHIALQTVASLSVICEPFLPFTSKKIKDMLLFYPNTWESSSAMLLSEGHAFGEVILLFDKIEDSTIQAQTDKLMQHQTAPPASSPRNLATLKDVISFEDFSKMDIRIGEITQAKRVEKSKKLLQLEINTGIDTRTVMSGIAEDYAPEDIIGRQVTILCNLAPRKIMGVESQGMILMVSDQNSGTLAFLHPQNRMPPGAVIG